MFFFFFFGFRWAVPSLWLESWGIYQDGSRYPLMVAFVLLFRISMGIPTKIPCPLSSHSHGLNHGKVKWDQTFAAVSGGLGQVLISDEELKGIFHELEQWGDCVCCLSIAWWRIWWRKSPWITEISWGSKNHWLLIQVVKEPVVLYNVIYIYI